MRLFIANLTRQSHDFLFRLIEDPRLHSITIPPGGQVQVAGDLQPEFVRNIVGQHERYGLATVREAKRSRRFVGLCYAHTPIDIDTILEANALNDRLLTEGATVTRQETALASAQFAEDQHTKSGRIGRMTGFQQAVEEVTPPRERVHEPLIDVVTVAAEGTEPMRRREWT